MKRIIVVVGHYGSGKTELSVNLAVNLKKEHQNVAILDLDIANPYFRSRERQKMMEDLGIWVHHNAYGYDITEDLPAISAGLRAPLENPLYYTVVDVGGDESGARILNQFKKYFLGDDVEMLCVVNANRPETDSVEGAIRHIERIENETEIKATGIVNNTHLLRETTVDDIIRGYELCCDVSGELKIPIIFNTCVSELCQELEEKAYLLGIRSFPIYPIELYMRPTWLDR